MVRETRAREGVATEFDSEHHRAVALFQSLSACRSVWKDFDPSICEQTCRGQVRSTVTPDSANAARPRTTEIDELRCVLLGKKPLVLMHRVTPEADSILRPGPFALGSYLLILRTRLEMRFGARAQSSTLRAMAGRCAHFHLATAPAPAGLEDHASCPSKRIDISPWLWPPPSKRSARGERPQRQARAALRDRRSPKRWGTSSSASRWATPCATSAPSTPSCSLALSEGRDRTRDPLLLDSQHQNSLMRGCAVRFLLNARARFAIGKRPRGSLMRGCW
jgi:hypothetical protein